VVGVVGDDEFKVDLCCKGIVVKLKRTNLERVVVVSEQDHLTKGCFVRIAPQVTQPTHPAPSGEVGVVAELEPGGLAFVRWPGRPWLWQPAVPEELEVLSAEDVRASQQGPLEKGSIVKLVEGAATSTDGITAGDICVVGHSPSDGKVSLFNRTTNTSVSSFNSEDLQRILVVPSQDHLFEGCCIRIAKQVANPTYPAPSGAVGVVAKIELNGVVFVRWPDTSHLWQQALQEELERVNLEAIEGIPKVRNLVRLAQSAPSRNFDVGVGKPCPGMLGIVTREEDGGKLCVTFPDGQVKFCPPEDLELMGVQGQAALK